MGKYFPKPFERVILHFDGDSFFASVEQVMDYTLKGQPLVTGGERGAITSASIEAKKLGVNRGLTLRAAKDLCPDLIIVPGDYLSYSIFARRMYSLVREFASNVEEYSIDECFADITGLDKVYNKSYEEVALTIKEKLETSLGITFGTGMGPSKVLAKVASKHRKPGGFTVINQESLTGFLQTLPVGKVWGIGPSMSIALGKLGIRTAEDLVESEEGWLEARGINQPLREIRLELMGYSLKNVDNSYDAPKSIIKSRTFSPPSTNRDFIFSQLSKNLEGACAQARREGLCPKEVYFYLKTQAFTYKGFNIILPVATSAPVEIMRWVRKHFDEVYGRGVEYRATGVSLKRFSEEGVQHDLFGESENVEKHSEVFRGVDKVAEKFGEHTLYLGSSMHARKYSGHRPEKHLDIPLLGIAR
jgi:DNA polymerase IV